MRGTGRWTAIAGIGAALLLAVGAGAGAPRAAGAKLTKVTVQLKWVTQAQFAGYYAAREKDFYRQYGLEVDIKPGGPSITPETVVAGGRAQFGLDWLPSLMSARDKGANLVNIAQVFTRSGLTLLTWKDSNLNTIRKLKGRRVANWLGGNEFEVYAALRKNGINPLDQNQVTIVQQPFSMDFFVGHQADAASAMTYNELAQVLEIKNPKTGKLFKKSDLHIFTMENVGTSMLEDGIFVRGDWIKKKANQQIAKRFVAATLKGWAYCRDHYLECTKITLRFGTALGRGHQRWQMNEINKLIWPTRLPVGVMDPVAFKRTARIALQFKAVRKPVSRAAYRTDIARAAVAMLRKQKVDVFGKRWKPATVKVTPGGA